MASSDFNVWSTISAGLFAALGVFAKSLWDSYVGFQDKIRLETWKIKVDQLERRLSEFYWPLYFHLARDDSVWTKVFFDIRPRHDRTRPAWIEKVPTERRAELALQIEDFVLLPNHLAAVQIISSKIHLADPDHEFRELLLKYVRHVDVYQALRAAKLDGVDPIDVGEPYPTGLSSAVEKHLRKYQSEYEQLLQDRGILRSPG